MDQCRIISFECVNLLAFHNLGVVPIFVKNLWAPALWPEDMKGRVKVCDAGIVMKGMAENWVWAKFCC